MILYSILIIIQICSHALVHAESVFDKILPHTANSGMQLSFSKQLISDAFKVLFEVDDVYNLIFPENKFDLIESEWPYEVNTHTY